MAGAVMAGFSISDSKELLDVERVHRFLTTHAYWCEGIPLETVKRAIENSLCFGVYQTKGPAKDQVGFGRVVTDGATFAWICDVYIEQEYRGKGLSKLLMETIMNKLSTLGLRRICLATRDAHELYKQFGFQVTATPQNCMEIKRIVYKKADE